MAGGATEALDQVSPHVGNDRINLANLAALTTILARAFGNPNMVAEAEAKLQSITQGSREFLVWLAQQPRHTSLATMQNSRGM